MFPPQIALQTWFLFFVVEEEKDIQFLTNPPSPLSKSAHFNLVLFPNIIPSFIRNSGFIIRGWHNQCCINDGRDWTKLCFQSHHAFIILVKNLSWRKLLMEWVKSLQNYHLILSFQLPPVKGIPLIILRLKMFFHGSPPSKVVVVNQVLFAFMWCILSTWLWSRSVLSQVKRLIWNFLWGSKDCSFVKAKVFWKAIIAPMKEGGLGLIDPLLQCKAFLG